MKRIALVVLVLMLAVTASVLVGCSDQTAQANAAIDESNKAVDAANGFDEEAARLFEQIGQLEPGEKSTEEALALTAQVEGVIQKKNGEIEKAIAELSKIGGMAVSEDFKVYAKQQTEIAGLQKQSDDLLLRATAEFKSVFENAGSKSPNMKALEANFTSIDDIFAQADELSTKIDEKAGASDAFFQEKGLGE